MSNPSRLLALTGVLLFSLCTASVSSAAYADPSGRVARLENTQGAVSYSPAGEDEWYSVVRNRPLIRGDRLWTDRDARAEFQVGSAAIRLGSNTSVEILDLNDRIAQVQLTQGTLNLSVRRMYPGQTYEVATPTLAFTINRAGRYRIDVDPRSAATTIVVWEGAGEAYGENSSFPLRTGDTVRFYDTDLRDYEMYGLPREDDFDRYSLERDRRLSAPHRCATSTTMWWVTRIWMRMAAGARCAATATCGSPAGSTPIGRRIGMVIGCGRNRGAGPGWTTHLGVSHPRTTDVGSTSPIAGAGYRGRAMCARSTHRRWSHSSAAATGACRSRSAAVRRSAGSRLGRAKSMCRPIRPAATISNGST